MRLLVFIVLLGVLLKPLHAAEVAVPLHAQIDQHLVAGQVGPMAGIASDGEFIRRLYLDLVGRIPSAAEARAFIDDKSTSKRSTAIDRLLVSSGYARNMANVFDVILMERRADKHVKGPEWHNYLRDAFAANKPWDKLAGEIISADGNSTAIPRPAAKFILDRDAEPNLVTRDIARKFFGMDLQCAQCHDHPNIADYYQRDYYGLYAFVSRSYIFQPDKKKPAALAEKASGEAKFKSVFTDVSGGSRPRVPAGFELTEPVIAIGEEWQVAPDPKKKNIRGIPKYSRREQLAKHASSSSYFRRNIANRLWGHMMGRALVEPPDGIQTDNPGSHPELLGILAEDFAARNYDIKSFLRELALSQTYQRRFELPGEMKMATTVAVLEAEQKKMSMAAETAQATFDKAHAALALIRGERFTVQGELDKTLKPVTDAKKANDAANKALVDAKKKLTDKEVAKKKVGELAANAKKVADEYKDDKELADPAAKLKAKADKLTAEVVAAQKDKDNKMEATKKAAAKLAATQKTRATAQTKWESVDKRVQEVDRPWQAAARAREISKNAEALAFRRLEDAQAMVELGKLQKAQVTTLSNLEEANKSLSAAKAALEPLNVELAKVRQSQAAAQKEHAAVSQALAGVKKVLSDKEARLKEGTDAMVAARESQKLLVQIQTLSTNAFLSKQGALKSSSTNAAARAQEAADKLQALQAVLDKEVKAAQTVVNQRAAVEKAAKAKLDSVNAAVRAVQTKMAAAQKRVADFTIQMAAAQKTVREGEAAVKATIEKLSQRWSNNFGVGTFTHLTPEQLCWSMLQATDQIDIQRKAGVADYDKKNPLKKDQKPDAAREATKAKHADQYAHDKLKGNTGNFIKLFGGAAGEVQTDFYATADQALFFANGGTVRGWTSTLAGRLNSIPEPKTLAEELYLSVLTRRPDQAEMAAVEAHLAGQKDKRIEAIREMTWGLLTSTEFRFKH